MARRIAGWLLLGLAVNLVVTAALALFAPQLGFRREIGEASSWRFAAPPSAPPPQLELIDTTIGETSITVQGGFDPEIIDELLDDCRIAGYLTNPPPHTAMGRRVGWPARSFAQHWSTFGVATRGAPVSLGDEIALLWERGVAVPLGRRRSLPLRPMWGGLAINSAVFGGLAWLCIKGPGMIRRAVRRRRRACISCGYRVEGCRTCPECGLDVEP